jgi:hypothetical protein
VTNSAVEAFDVSHLQNQIFSGGNVQKFFGFTGLCGYRFFDQDVYILLQGLLGYAVVKACGHYNRQRIRTLTLYQVFYAGVRRNPQILAYKVAPIFVCVGHPDKTGIQQLRVHTSVMLTQMPDSNYPHPLETGVHFKPCLHTVTSFKVLTKTLSHGARFLWRHN